MHFADMERALLLAAARGEVDVSEVEHEARLWREAEDELEKTYGDPYTAVTRERNEALKRWNEAGDRFTKFWLKVFE